VRTFLGCGVSGANAPEEEVVKVEIWSDVVCPWCHVGLSRFEEAVRRLGWADDDIQIVYRPFELDRRVPQEGVDLADYLKAKFGPAASIRSIEGRVGEAGAEVGIDFQWAGMRRANTFDAHRLLEWALDTAGAPTQVRLKRRLMRAYFEEQGDVADHDSLADLAADVGLDRTEATAVLADGRYGEAVRAGEAEAQELEIHAVPTFVIERRIAIPGAQEPETFVTMLARLRSRLADEAAEAAALASGVGTSAVGTAGVACAVDEPDC
jgi:predicted DsbA family dithiol-disulfide isomerase